MSLSIQQEMHFKKVLGELAILAALLPEDSEQQNAVIEAVGDVAKAMSIQGRIKS